MSFDKFETENLTKNDKIENELGTKAEFEILKILGKGEFGQVFRVKNTKNVEK